MQWLYSIAVEYSLCLDNSDSVIINWTSVKSFLVLLNFLAYFAFNCLWHLPKSLWYQNDKEYSIYLTDRCTKIVCCHLCKVWRITHFGLSQNTEHLICLNFFCGGSVVWLPWQAVATSVKLSYRLILLGKKISHLEKCKIFDCLHQWTPFQPVKKLVDKTTPLSKRAMHLVSLSCHYCQINDVCSCRGNECQFLAREFVIDMEVVWANCVIRSPFFLRFP